MIKGIDISHYQAGRVNYAALRPGGVEFAILKVSEGVTLADASFSAHYSGMRAAGIPVGAYAYCRATSVAEAEAEARAAVRALEYRALQLPLFYDIEEDALRLGGDSLLFMAAAFARVVTAAGYRFGVYSNQLGFWYLCPPERLRAAVPDAAVWVARYGASSVGVDGAQLWQYTNAGSIPGVSGDVDVDILYDEGLIRAGAPTADPVPDSGTGAPQPKADAVVRMLQSCMAQDGYWPEGQITGFKSREFREKIKEYAADVART